MNPSALNSPKGLISALLLCLVLALSGFGCGVKKKAPLPEPEPLSQSASLTYDYLLYQDYLRRIEELGLSGLTDEQRSQEFLRWQAEAAAALDRIIAVEPTAMLYAEKGSLYFNLKQAGQARTILKQGLEAFPGDRVLTTVLASAYLLENDVENAVITVESYLLDAPDDHEVRQRLAEMLIEAMEYQQAVDHLERIPEDHRSAETDFLLGRAYSRMGQAKPARQALLRALEQAPGFIEAWAELAFLDEMAKDYQSAAKVYSRILELGGPEEEVRLRLITLNLKMAKPEQALSHALAGPGQKSFLLSAALLFIDEDYPAQASAVLDVLATSEPIPGEYYYYKAFIAYQAEDDPGKALEYLSQVDAADPTYSRALQFRIQVLNGEDRTDEALALARQAQQEHPDESVFAVLESEILSQSGDRAGALRVLEAALATYPGDTDLLYRYGALLEKNGDRDKAMEVMESILKIDPLHGDALNYVGYTLADENRDLDRALTLVRQSLSRDPDNGYIVDSLAWVYFRMDELDRAWAEIQRAAELVDDDPVIWEHYGDIAQAMGKKITALKAFQKALQYGAEDPARVKQKIEGL